jgi:hypothetical protein
VYRRLVHVRILVAFMSCRDKKKERTKYGVPARKSKSIWTLN